MPNCAEIEDTTRTSQSQSSDGEEGYWRKEKGKRKKKKGKRKKGAEALMLASGFASATQGWRFDIPFLSCDFPFPWSYPSFPALLHWDQEKKISPDW
jgi:hypothetical protein